MWIPCSLEHATCVSNTWRKGCRQSNFFPLWKQWSNSSSPSFFNCHAFSSCFVLVSS